MAFLVVAPQENILIDRRWPPKGRLIPNLWTGMTFGASAVSRVVLSFNVIVPTGHGIRGNFTGSTFIEERLEPTTAPKREASPKTVRCLPERRIAGWRWRRLRHTGPLDRMYAYGAATHREEGHCRGTCVVAVCTTSVVGTTPTGQHQPGSSALHRLCARDREAIGRASVALTSPRKRGEVKAPAHDDADRRHPRHRLHTLCSDRSRPRSGPRANRSSARRQGVHNLGDRGGRQARSRERARAGASFFPVVVKVECRGPTAASRCVPAGLRGEHFGRQIVSVVSARLMKARTRLSYCARQRESPYCGSKRAAARKGTKP